jgi:hypothetical protein
MLLRLFVAVAKYLRKGSEKEGFILARSFRGFSPSWLGGCGRAGQFISYWEERRGAHFITSRLLSSSVFILSRLRAIGWCHPHSEQLSPHCLVYVLWKTPSQIHPSEFY